MVLSYPDLFGGKFLNRGCLNTSFPELCVIHRTWKSSGQQCWFTFWRCHVEFSSQRLSILPDNFVIFHSPSRTTAVLFLKLLVTPSIHKSFYYLTVYFLNTLHEWFLYRDRFFIRKNITNQHGVEPILSHSCLMLPVYGDSISKSRRDVTCSLLFLSVCPMKCHRTDLSFWEKVSFDVTHLLCHWTH